MKPTNFFYSVIGLILCIALNTTLAYSQDITSLSGDIKNYQLEKLALNQKLALTLRKLGSTQKRLTDLQADLKSKEFQLFTLKESLGQSPTTEQKEFISNGENRIKLCLMAIKSRQSTIARLQRRQRNIQEASSRLDTLTSEATNTIASAERDSKAKKQATLLAKARQIKRELDELKKDNSKLRIAMIETSKKARAARDVNKQLTEIAQKQKLSPKAPKVRQPQKEERVVQLEFNQNQSQVVLPGERSIYKKNDLGKMILRNRGKKESAIMASVAANIYQAEITLGPGKSYFDIQKRRYRSSIPKQDGTAIYVFTYDRTNQKNPKLSARVKAIRSDQMLSNTSAPF